MGQDSFQQNALHDQRVIMEKALPQKSELYETYEQIMKEMTTFKDSLSSKIELFEGRKDDILKQVTELETQHKEKKTWIEELDKKEK